MKKDTMRHRLDTSKPHAGPRLALKRETVRTLMRYELVLVAGGASPITEKTTEEPGVVSPC
jgi:hypothetical protein